MHGKGAHEASRRTAPAKLTSIHSSALGHPGGFWAVFRDVAQKSKIFPKPNRFRPVSPRGHAKLCMEKVPTKPHGAPRPQNRLLYIQVRSVILAILGRFFRDVAQELKFSRTKPVPAGLTPGAVQSYAWKRGPRSLTAHRALKIDFYTFKCARSSWRFWGVFLYFCRGRGRS